MVVLCSFFVTYRVSVRALHVTSYVYVRYKNYNKTHFIRVMLLYIVREESREIIVFISEYVKYREREREIVYNKLLYKVINIRLFVIYCVNFSVKTCFVCCFFFGAYTVVVYEFSCLFT